MSTVAQNALLVIAVALTAIVVGAVLSTWIWLHRERREIRAMKQASIDLRARANISQAKTGFYTLLLHNDCRYPSIEQLHQYFASAVAPIENPLTGKMEPILERSQSLVAESEGESLRGRTIVSVNGPIIKFVVIGETPLSPICADAINPFIEVDPR